MLDWLWFHVSRSSFSFALDKSSLSAHPYTHNDPRNSYVKRQRTELREKYGIPGSTNNDCWATFCCLPCAQIQLDKEVELRETRVNKDGYRRQDGMTMPNHDPNAPTMGAPAMGHAPPPQQQPQMQAAPQHHAPASHGIAPATSGSYATPQQPMDSKHPIDSKPPPPQY